MVQETDRPRVAEVLRRGVRRRCPRCGEGALFRRGITAHERCSECGLLYQRDQGDTWIFTIIMDRIPLLGGIAAVYFGFQAHSWWLAALFWTALVLPTIATIRERQGLALALNYLSRLYFPDPSDEIHAASR